MPNTRYRHYKWHKRVTDFPFTHAVATAVLFSSIVFAISWGATPVGEHMGLALIAFAIPACILILLGLQWKGQVITGYGIEQTGHWLAVGAWICNIWLLFTLGGSSTLVAPAIFAIAHSLRAYRLYQEARNIKHAVREAARQQKVGVLGD